MFRCESLNSFSAFLLSTAIGVLPTVNTVSFKPILSVQEAQDMSSSSSSSKSDKIIWGDFDADADRDLLILTGNSLSLYRNQTEEKNFVNITNKLLATPQQAKVNKAFFLDIDQDKREEIHIIASDGNYQIFQFSTDRLPEGEFEEISQRFHFSPDSTSGQWLDFDQDGYPDFIVPMPNGTFQLYRSLKGLEFEQAVQVQAMIPLLEETVANPNDLLNDEIEQKTNTPVSGGSGSHQAPPPGTDAGDPEGDIVTVTCSSSSPISIRNSANTSQCIAASTTPTLGMLYPLGTALNVNASGEVGIGTTTIQQNSQLQVRGTIGIDANTSDSKWQIFGTTSAFAIKDQDRGIYPFWINNSNGYVGLGTYAPQARLDVRGDTILDHYLYMRDYDNGSYGITRLISRDDNWMFWSSGVVIGSYGDNALGPVGAGNLVVQNRVGIGGGSPSALLHIKGNDPNPLKFERTGYDIYGFEQSTGAGMAIKNYTDGAREMYFAGNGNVGIGTTTPSAKLEVAGRTKTQILEITGGSDLAEPFDVKEQITEPGMVLSIDPENPGKLRLTRSEYDRTVVGIASGAGGVNPGLTLSQEGKLEGQVPVALTGRVYCWCDASYGEIKPGDLITSSSTPGHAMKASELSRATGAIVGKALTPLKEGKGLVLIVVSLQ